MIEQMKERQEYKSRKKNLVIYVVAVIQAMG